MCPLCHRFSPFFNPPLETVVAIIIIILLNNTNDDPAACPGSTCGAAAPGSGDGAGSGALPGQGRHPHPRLLPTRIPAVPGAGAAGLGLVPGHLPAGPPSQPRIPAGSPGMMLQPPASKTDRLWRGV